MNINTLFQYVWKIFKNRPFTGPATSSPFRFCKTKVLFPRILIIVKGPSHKLSNFPCFPFSSFLASHVRTTSPTEKVSFLTFLSKFYFTFFLYISSFSTIASLSCCNLTIQNILLFISSDSSSTSYKNVITRKLCNTRKLHQFHKQVEKVTFQWIYLQLPYLSKENILIFHPSPFVLK